MAQQTHQSDPRVLNRRTLQQDHRTLAKFLLRTSASNNFEGVLTDTADTNLDALLNEEELLVDRLAGTDLSGAHVTAQKNLDRLDAALHAASRQATTRPRSPDGS